MTKISIAFLVVLALAFVPAQFELPFSESVEITDADHQYNLDLTFPVYVKKDSTYHIEDRKIHITIGPQDWVRSDTKGSGQEYTGYFLKVFVSIVLSDAKGRISEDFESYLNYELENCDTVSRKGRLFWDHAGEKRADKAGESFEEKTPVVVADEYVTVLLSVVGFRLARYNDCFTDTGPCESDADCLVYLQSLTLRLDVDYSILQLEYRSLSAKASEHEIMAASLFQEGQLDEARTEYEKAKAVYDQTGETLKAGTVQEKIDEIDFLRASAYGTLAEEYFNQEEYEKAKEEYEKAKAVYDQLGDTEKSGEMQERIDVCSSYLVALETLEEGIQLFEEAKTKYGQRAEAYEKAKSCFEKAKTEFDQLEEAQKSEECTTWMNRCDEERGKLVTEKVYEDEATSFFTYRVLVIVIAGVGIVIVLVIVIRSPARTEIPEEPDELETLKRRLAAGEISVEEYEEVKSTLENE